MTLWLRPPNPYRKQHDNFDAQCECDGCDVWESADGPIPICQMGDFHLARARDKVADWGYDFSDYGRDRQRDFWLDAFDAELRRRGMV